MISSRLKPELTASIEAWWTVLDKSGSGVVRLTDFTSGVSALSVTEAEARLLFQKMDRGRCGFLDKKDWFTLCLSTFQNPAVARIQNKILERIRSSPLTAAKSLDEMARMCCSLVTATDTSTSSAGLSPHKHIPEILSEMTSESESDEDEKADSSSSYSSTPSPTIVSSAATVSHSLSTTTTTILAPSLRRPQQLRCSKRPPRRSPRRRPPPLPPRSSATVSSGAVALMRSAATVESLETVTLTTTVRRIPPPLPVSLSVASGSTKKKKTPPPLPFSVSSSSAVTVSTRFTEPLALPYILKDSYSIEHVVNAIAILRNRHLSEEKRWALLSALYQMSDGLLTLGELGRRGLSASKIRAALKHVGRCSEKAANGSAVESSRSLSAYLDSRTKSGVSVSTVEEIKPLTCSVPLPALTRPLTRDTLTTLSASLSFFLSEAMRSVLLSERQLLECEFNFGLPFEFDGTELQFIDELKEMGFSYELLVEGFVVHNRDASVCKVMDYVLLPESARASMRAKARVKYKRNVAAIRHHLCTAPLRREHEVKQMEALAEMVDRLRPEQWTHEQMSKMSDDTLAIGLAEMKQRLALEKMRTAEVRMKALKARRSSVRTEASERFEAFLKGMLGGSEEFGLSVYKASRISIEKEAFKIADAEFGVILRRLGESRESLERKRRLGVKFRVLRRKKQKCVVCMDAASDVLLLPCLHLVLCQSCVKHAISRTPVSATDGDSKEQPPECPICRQGVEDYRRVHL